MRGRALVLNASIEPLGVVSLNRAVRLVVDGKAEVVVAAEDLVRSEDMEFPSPSVIKLAKYVHVPYRARAPLTRRGVLARDGNECGYCGGRADTVDHVLPRAQGGLHRWENVVAACRRCNHKKRDRTPEQAGMALRFEPRTPAGALALVVVLREVDERWGEFLDVENVA